MMPLILVFAGVMIMWIGSTDAVMDIAKTDTSKLAPGYPDIPFIPYAVAALLVTLPLVFIPDNDEWAWKYILLILVMAVVTNYEGIAKFSQDLSGVYGGK